MFRIFWIVFVIAAWAAFDAPGEQSLLQTPTAECTFRVVGLKTPFEHTFVYTNTTKETLQVSNVVVTSPLVFIKGTSKINPGATGEATVAMGQPRIIGEYEGWVRIVFAKSEPNELTFACRGDIVPAIEISPMAAFYVAAQRGETKSASVRLINHEEEELSILSVEHNESCFTTSLRTREFGWKYELVLTLKPDAAVGRRTDLIRVRTSSKSHPIVTITANTFVHERVYSFPDALDLGTIRRSDLLRKPELTDLLSQTLMVYQCGGSAFRVQAEPTLSFLQVAVADSDLGDRSQLTVSVLPEKLTAGGITGSIVVASNDRECGRLEIPVRGVVVE